MTPQRAVRSAFVDRLTFILLVLLALTFAFEIPLGGTLASTTFTTVEVLQLLVIGCWLLARVTTRTLPRFPAALTLLAVLWLVVMLISALLTPDSLAHTLRFLSRIVQGLLLAWIVYDVVDSESRWRVLVRALVIAGFWVAILGLAEAANNSSVVRFLTLFRPSQTRVGNVIRVSATLSYATVTAMVLEMVIPLTLAWAVTARRRWAQVSLMGALAISVACLVLTLTRSAILGLGISLLVVAGVSLWRHQRQTAFAALGTLVLTAVMIGTLFLVNRTIGLRLLSENENGWYQARYDVPPALTARPNEWLNVPVQLTNSGVLTWQSGGDSPFRLGYTVLQSSEIDPPAIALDGIRTALSDNVPPGQSISVVARVPAPEMPGQYLIQWDMVEENILWFSWRGSPLASTLLTVAGTPLPKALMRGLPPATRTASAPPVERGVLWRAALDMFRDNPLFGVGPDNFRWLYGRYLALERWDANIHANSIYFELLADTGLIGLIAFLGLNGSWLRRALRYLAAQPDRAQWVWQLAILASLIAWYVHGFLDYFYEFSGTYILFWLIAGLAVSIAVCPADEVTHRLRKTSQQEA